MPSQLFGVTDLNPSRQHFRQHPHADLATSS